MGVATAAIVGGAAAAGAVAGSMKDKSTQEQSSGVNLAPQTSLELQGQDWASQGYSGFAQMVNAGPGQEDYTNGVQAQRDLATTYQNYANGGFLPNAQDQSTSNNLAASLFGQQRVGLQQSMVQATQNANMSAAAMGRDTNDPILQAKLQTNYANQSAMLNAQQGAAASQFAMQMPGQRLQYQQAYASQMGGLATQAMSNRQALAAMGDGILQQERNWQYQSGTHWGNQTQESGGGVKGAINGGLAGLGAGMSAVGGMGGGATGGPAGTSGYGGAGNFQAMSAMGAPNAGPQMSTGYAPAVAAQQAPSYGASSFTAYSPMGGPNVGPQPGGSYGPWAGGYGFGGR